MRTWSSKSWSGWIRCAPRQAAQQQIVDDIQGSFGSIRAELDEQLAEIDAEATVVRGQRAEFAAGLDAGMLAIYEKTLAKRGVGAARLFHGTSEGSGMQLEPGRPCRNQGRGRGRHRLLPGLRLHPGPLRRVGLATQLTRS